MRTVDCEQGTPEWFEARRGSPTASRFDKIITPATGKYSKSSKTLMCELIAEGLPGYEPWSGTGWMEWGKANEPTAARQYAFENDVEVSEVGFCLLDDRDDLGASPDGLVGDVGLLEVKCPKPETLIRYHADGQLPLEYKCQVQGQLWVTGRSWCDFYVWHSQLEPFQIRVRPDTKFIDKMIECMDQFCAEYAELKERITI